MKWEIVHSVRGSRRSHLSGGGGGIHVTPLSIFCFTYLFMGDSCRWAVCLGRTPPIRKQRRPKVGSARSEIGRRVPRAKACLTVFPKQGTQPRKRGLANGGAFLVEARSVGQATPGVRSSSRARVHIDPAVWSLVVGSGYPGSAGGAKGRTVRPLKAHVSWVQYVARQYGSICWGCCSPERKVLPVRQERRIGASGHPVVTGRPGSYAPVDKA